MSDFITVIVPNELSSLINSKIDAALYIHRSTV